MLNVTETFPADPGEQENNDFPQAGPHALSTWGLARPVMRQLSRFPLSAPEKIVLLSIGCHIASNDEGWPTQETLALYTSFTPRHVRRMVDDLVRKGFLVTRHVPRGGRLPNGTIAMNERVLYGCGPKLLGGPELHKAAPRPKPVTGLAPAAPPAPLPQGGHLGPADPDKMSAKEEFKEEDPSLPPTPPEPSTPPASQESERASARQEEKSAADVPTVLSHWKNTLLPELRGPVDRPYRVATVLARLADGFTVEELCHAIDAAKESPWHCAEGQEHRLAVGTLFGKAESVSSLAKKGRALSEAREREQRARQRRRAEMAAAREQEREQEQRAMTRAEMVAAAAALMAALEGGRQRAA